MRSRLLWRRSATAVGLYASLGLGILTMVVAARALGKVEFGLFATAFAAASFFQMLLDLTVEESLTKLGFRYVVQNDWGRLRRLFARALQLKLVGGAVAALAVAALAPAAETVFGTDDLFWPVLVSALLPLVAAPEGVGLAALLLRRRYDLRAWYQSLQSAVRLVGLAVGVQFGVTGAIAGLCAGQVIASTVAATLGVAVLRRFPAAPQRSLGEDRRYALSFVAKSSIATGVISLRTTLAPLLLGVVAGPTHVGLLRVAQAPQTGLQAASSPVRLILLTEQTEGWERGREREVVAGVRRYMVAAAGAMAVAVPVFMIAMPWLVELVFGREFLDAVDAARIVLVAAAILAVLGWTKSFPVTIGRPGLRILAHGIEAGVLLPLILVLGNEWGVTGAAVAILGSVTVFAMVWAVLLVRVATQIATPDARAADVAAT